MKGNLLLANPLPETNHCSNPPQLLQKTSPLKVKPERRPRQGGSQSSPPPRSQLGCRYPHLFLQPLLIPTTPIQPFLMLYNCPRIPRQRRGGQRGRRRPPPPSNSFSRRKINRRSWTLPHKILRRILLLLPILIWYLMALFLLKQRRCKMRSSHWLL